MYGPEASTFCIILPEEIFLQFFEQYHWGPFDDIVLPWESNRKQNHPCQHQEDKPDSTLGFFPKTFFRGMFDLS
jgi:hypothetical protein